MLRSFGYIRLHFYAQFVLNVEVSFGFAEQRRPYHYLATCLSCNRHREVDLLRTIVVRCVLCRRPC